MSTDLTLVISEELAKLVDGMRAQFTNPEERIAVAAMAADIAVLPVRMARGEDVAPLVAALKAEAANRALAHRVRAETLAQQTWLAVIARVLTAALT